MSVIDLLPAPPAPPSEWIFNGPAPAPGQRFFFEPVCIGPTWKRDEAGKFILPKWTLGWEVLRWVKDNLIALDGSGPFNPTAEQRRFILWWYAVDEHGRFMYRDGVLQRLKGWGKDPLAAILAAVELVGPCRFAGWSKVAVPEKGIGIGDPVGKQHPRAWIQIAAVSKSQTGNTMKLFPGLFSKECVAEHRIAIGTNVIYAHGGQRQIQAVTSSPRALEGGRPTFVIRNETHHWIESNDGHDMADVIARNRTKSADGAARALSITNAYKPSENSVAQKQREAWENEESGLTMKTGVLYDSLEAPEDARLVFDGEWLFDLAGVPYPDDLVEREDLREALIMDYLRDIVTTVRGDSVWLDPQSLVLGILDKTVEISQSQRFWFNMIVSPEDAWVDPIAVKAAIDPMARDALLTVGDRGHYDTTWLVDPSERVVMFFDGSKSDDSTGIVATCVDRDYSFVIGVWEKPKGGRGEKWLAPRGEVRQRALAACERLNVVAFWADPSHAKDDEDDSHYWDGVIDAWHREVGFRFEKTYWASHTGGKAHSIMWDMSSPEHQAQFVAAAMRTVDEFENLNDIEEFDPLIHIDGHPALVRHLQNAKSNPSSRYGVSLMKENRESLRKIDLAVCLVGARMLRRVILNLADDKPPAGGELWW